MSLEHFEKVLGIAKRASDPAPAWAELIGYLESLGSVTLSNLRDMDAREDVVRLRTQLEAVLATEPPAENINAIYFGLFDRAADNRNECMGFYVAGMEAYDPEKRDSLCNPAWWPKGRYLSSAGLDAVKAAELAARASSRDELDSLLGYAGQLGAALILAKFSSVALFGARRRLVGFDSGDVAELLE